MRSLNTDECAANHIDGGGFNPLDGKCRKFGAGHQLEKFAGQVRAAAVARRPIGQLPRIFFASCYQSFNVCHR